MTKVRERSRAKELTQVLSSTIVEPRVKLMDHLGGETQNNLRTTNFSIFTKGRQENPYPSIGVDRMQADREGRVENEAHHGARHEKTGSSHGDTGGKAK